MEHTKTHKQKGKGEEQHLDQLRGETASSISERLVEALKNFDQSALKSVGGEGKKEKRRRGRGEGERVKAKERERQMR